MVYFINEVMSYFLTEEKLKQVDPEKEKELNDRIQKIKEQNEKILERKKMIENDIELYA